MIKITVEDTETKVTHTFEYKNITISQQHGRRERVCGSRLVDILPSDQERLQIRAWSGCPSYDSFAECLTEEEV